jgi:LuxR family maltose regulon positive regulatory protein
VTLDAGDNDPGRLWTYVATAVGRIREGLAHEALRRLRASDGSVTSAVDELLNGIAAYGDELVILLDDVQTLTEGECLASIGHALEHLPPNARFLAITRTDPELRLPHLRARGALVELRADDLAFTAAETHELLVERCGLELDATEVELLRERTEGWPAALFLAALWLRGVDDPHRSVREFGGDHRFVAEYLSQEVIGSLDGETRSLLLRAAVLRRFTPELFDGLFGTSDAAVTFAELERSNPFVSRLAQGGWYRVHPLFAEYASFQLASEEPGAVPSIHRRAAHWLRSRGLAVEAVQHAAAAGDHELVAELLVEYHLPMIRGGAAQTLLRWVETLPDEEIVAHPELAVGGATAATMVGRAFDRRRLLALAVRAEAERPERCTPYVRAVAGMVEAAAVDGDVGQAVAAGRRAVEIAEADADPVLVAALGGYARALYLAGEPDEAWHAALRAVEHPDAARRAPGHAFARSTLALVAVDQGRLGVARTHAAKAKALVGGAGSSRSWLGANPSVALGAVLAAEGHLAEGERELASAERFFRDEVATVHHAWLLVLLARVRCRRGRLDDADATLRAARDALAEIPDGGRVPALADEVERELARARTRATNGEILDRPSEAELAVLRLLATDLSTSQIGGKLFLSPNTVRSHTRALYRKLAVNSRLEAVARADALGLLEPAAP